MRELTRTSLDKGPYLGDVSALCLLPSLSSSPLPYLLAGTGPQLLLYELATGKLLLSVHAFDGVRVYGIHALPHSVRPLKVTPEPTVQAAAATIAVHGERRVKVFELYWRHSTCQADLAKLPEFLLRQSLPRLFHWVLDVRFLQASAFSEREKGGILLAVGLSDNSVSLWDLRQCVFIYRVECSERSLLYSLRLWGVSIETLQVAAGTIFNKVLIWKLGSQASMVAVEVLRGFAKLETRGEGEEQQDQRMLAEIADGKGDNSLLWVQTAQPLQELVGHEGSIHRMAWSDDGLHLASASDDRSVRIWSSSSLKSPTCNEGPWSGDMCVQAGPVLYGHGGRVWDCHIADKLLITASEDCTCRVWTPEGYPLANFTGHTGRGIWRCVYDKETATLVTAGADTSIKVQSLVQLAAKVHVRGHGEKTEVSQRQNTLLNTEVFSVSLQGPNVLGQGDFKSMDSDSEYVRCLRLSGPRTLYVATNQGHIHQLSLLESGEHAWASLTEGDVEGPIVCMDVLVTTVANVTTDYDDDSWAADEIVAFGNGLGIVTVLGIQATGVQPSVLWQCAWLADHERQLLGVFWCQALGRRYVFSTDPRGLVRVWFLENLETTEDTMTLSDLEQEQGLQRQALLLAVCRSPLHARIVCLDVCPSQQLLVCGDQRGNLVSFSFPRSLLHCKDKSAVRDNLGLPVQLQGLGVFKGAHGISSVASLLTGRDGCICKFTYDPGVLIGVEAVSTGQGLVCTGVENVTAITVVESLEYCHGLDRPKKWRQVVAGFMGSDFLLRDLTNKSELMRVACGGWRRPHSCVIGAMPELQHCFSYLKDHVIYVHRNWITSQSVLQPLPVADMPATETTKPVMNLVDGFNYMPHCLHGQFHGKEIHSVHFIPSGPLSSEGELCSDWFSCPVSWIASGAEDGTVRVTRYCPESLEQLDSSMVLGEHTGGSAVRALTLVRGVHTLLGQDFARQTSPLVGGKGELEGQPLLLLSVGAKEVLTCWHLKWRQDCTPDQILCSKWKGVNGACSKNVDPSPSLNGLQDEPYSLEPVLIRHASSDGISDKRNKVLTSLGKDDMYQSHPLLGNHLQDVCATPANPGRWALSPTWLSSYSPRHVHHPLKKSMKSAVKPEGDCLMSVADTSCVSDTYGDAERKEHKEREVVCRKETGDEDDLRYLAITAFSTRDPWTEVVVCFVVTASSNAKLKLHAFHVMAKFWVEVAVLEYHVVPVLALQHLVVPLDCSTPGSCSNAFLVISGATDGSIAVWNITDFVVKFSSKVSAGDLKPKSTLEAQLRPLTGRGSQGGQKWRSSRQRPSGLSQKRNKDGKKMLEDDEGILELTKEDEERFGSDEESGTTGYFQESFLSRKAEVAKSSVGEDRNGYLNEGVPSCSKGKLMVPAIQSNLSGHDCSQSAHSSTLVNRDFSLETSTPAPAERVIHVGIDNACKADDSSLVLHPIHIFSEAHQSGVNCLCTARVEKEKGLVYVVVSGGDDQALNVAKFTLQFTTAGELTGAMFVNEAAQLGSVQLKCLGEDSIPCAHHSAVKGVWTDGMWVFSTGLDQRIRCWLLFPSAAQGYSHNRKSQEKGGPVEQLTSHIPLVECTHSVIDVPEAEALHVEPRPNGDHYRIVVAGRGMQILDFYSGSQVLVREKQI